MQAEEVKQPDPKKVQEIEEFVESIKVPRIVNKGFSTTAIHKSVDPEQHQGSLSTPIYMSATFGMKTCDEAYSKHFYGRMSTPTSDAMELTMAALEHGKYAKTFCTGVMPLYAMFTLLKAGDHILLPFECYSGTRLIQKEILTDEKGYNLEFVKMEDTEAVKKAIRPETKLILLETPSNPKLFMTDIEAIVEFVKGKGIITMIDNTIATPYLMNPLDMGIDVVMHSYAKYIGGHSDLMGGVLVMNDADLFQRVQRHCLLTGTTASPFNHFLAIRGLKTLKLRLDASCRSAYIIAHWLKAHRNVDRVYFPGLEDHPGHELAKKMMKGYGAMIAFEIKGDMERAKKVVNDLNLFTIGGSLGGVESLVQLTIRGTHMFFSAEEVKAMDIKDTLIRLSIGCEDVTDLILDLDQALDY